MGNENYGHYIVIRGIDEKGTPGDRTDDDIIINDPYRWNSSYNGNDKKLSYQEFFVKASGGKAWFRDAIQFTPVDTYDQREYAVLVDSGNNSFGGNATIHSFQLDDPDGTSANGNPIWKFYYGGGGTGIIRLKQATLQDGRLVCLNPVIIRSL